MAGTDHSRGSGLGRNFQERKIGRVVKNIQRIRSMKAGMGPPYGSLETSKKGWNRSSSGGERVVLGNFPRKRSKKAETSRNGSTESFNEGWNGSLNWVVKNVQKLLEQAIDDVQERLTRRGFVGTNNLSLETGRGRLKVDEEGNPPSETIKEGWNGSLEQVFVVNVRRSLEQAVDEMMFKKSWDRSEETSRLKGETGRRKLVVIVVQRGRERVLVQMGCHQHTATAGTGCRQRSKKAGKGRRNRSIHCSKKCGTGCRQ
jgi:hypothetical protein